MASSHGAPHITAKLPAFMWARCSSHVHASIMQHARRKSPAPGFDPAAFATWGWHANHDTTRAS
eukprot:4496510-Prymnesium_polylepis.1